MMGRYDRLVTGKAARMPGDYAKQADAPKKSKHRAVAVTIDGIRFQSKMEAERYGELRLLQQAGKIRGLKVHPEYVVCRAVCRHGYRAMPAAKYIADFQYWEEFRPGEGFSVCVVEDVKGKPTDSKWSKQHVVTPVYRLKRQLFLAQYPDVEFREIRKGK